MVSRRDVLFAGAAVTTGCARVSPASRRLVREVAALVDGVRTRDGAGVSLLRALGHGGLSALDPFLLLDEMHSSDPNDFEAGFPEHPHRGFETVTYLLEGAVEHHDSAGNGGRLGPGTVQWMTAGRGIVHAEMPKSAGAGLWGFQLWVNLPRARKLIAPRYQNVEPGLIPTLERERARLKVVAGQVEGKRGPVEGIDVAPLFVDVALEREGKLELALPPGHTSFVFVADGSLRMGDGRREVHAGQVAVLSKGDAVRLEGEAPGARAFVFAGQPWREPIARSGPFVMNTDDELRQAWADYRSGRLTQGL